MNYVELNIPLHATENVEEKNDILVALLSDYPFESFMTENGVLKAYIPQDKLVDCMGEVDSVLHDVGVLDATYIEIESKDWNAVWEAEFKSVDVDGICTIRAPFSPAPESGMDVIIMPKMSFGTGHHATTCLMISEIMKLQLAGKTGADVGSGTGVLSIVAVKAGAKQVDAVDIDTWAYENCLENTAANGVEQSIKVLLGDVTALTGNKYDFVLANINRNILLNDMESYAKMLNEGGDLVMSGILERDIDSVVNKAQECGLKFVHSALRNGWAAILCEKI